jgi:hypothetical protein
MMIDRINSGNNFIPSGKKAEIQEDPLNVKDSVFISGSSDEGISLREEQKKLEGMFSLLEEEHKTDTETDWQPVN